MSFEPKATYPPADALYESTEEKKQRLTHEISELAGKVETAQDEYERYEQQAGIAARNGREIAHKGGPGHLQVSDMMEKSAKVSPVTSQLQGIKPFLGPHRADFGNFMVLQAKRHLGSLHT